MDAISILPARLRRAAADYLKRRGLAPMFNPALVDRVWIDVGAHIGQNTLDAAKADPHLLVFAFEPNWALARQIMGRAANYVVLPIAASDRDGFAEFNISETDYSSSLVGMEEAGLPHWKDFDLRVKSRITVQTMRMDTFLSLASIPSVDYLKIDAEGVDMQVLRSTGDRLKDIHRIQIEVDTAPDRLYQGSASQSEVTEYLTTHGFQLTHTEPFNNGRQADLIFTSLRTCS